MRKFNLPLVAEGLTAYAIERQNGFERHQPDGAPPWAEQRRFWTDVILQGMARLDGLTPDTNLMGWFDQRMKAIHGGSSIETLPLKEQNALIHELNKYLSELEADSDDQRQQIAVVKDLMQDMSTHFPWIHCKKELTKAICSADNMLMRMTAKRPVRFTYVTLSGYPVSCTSDFVSGAVKDAEEVKATELYQKMMQWHPKAKGWNVTCSTYVGGNGNPSCKVIDATDFDMSIIRMDEYRFLKQPGLRAVDHQELYINTYESIRALKVEPEASPEIVTVPNTLEALQAMVGGYIEAVGLDCGVTLICNEEGKLMELPANRRVGNDIIAGTFLIVGESDGEFCSLSDKDTVYYTEQFAQPLLSQTDSDQPTQWEFRVL